MLAVDDLAPDELRPSLESVCRQIYPHWQLIVVARSSLASAARTVLDEFARANERIMVHRLHADGGEAEALNHALSVAGGAFAVVLKAGDRLAEHALFHVAREIVNHPEVDWIYSDEDQLTAAGQRILPFFKPDWSPELIVSSPYTGHLSAYRASLVRTLGGWRGAFASAHHYDLALRTSAATANIRHVPDILYHAREHAGGTLEHSPGNHAAAERQVLVDHFRRVGLPATVEPSPVGGYHRVRRAVRGNPLVSVVIPTASQGVERNGAFVWHVLNCVRSIREQSTYRQIEIVVVDNNDMPRALAESLRPYGVVQVPYTRRFNLSAKMNLGAQRSRGDYIVFLNDDIEMISPDWAEGMLEHAQDRQVGAVGVKLLFPNDHVQHAGVIWTEFGPDHLFYDEKQAALARYLPALVPRELMAVTGACVMVKKTDHELIGGWNEALPLNFNDIDLCLRLIDRGRRNIYTPYVTMRHYESASKTNDEKIDANIQRECKVFMDIWRGKYPVDPYYNRNFILARAFYRIDSRSA